MAPTEPVVEPSTSVKVLVLFGMPVDEDLFARYLQSVHLSLIDELDGLRARTVDYIDGTLSGESPFYVLIELAFADEVSMQHALNSVAGQAIARDYSNFASGGVTVLFARTSESRIR